MDPLEKPSIPKLILAFGSIYFIWGSTYVAIHYAIQTLPGFLMAAVRFMVARAIVCAVAYWHGARLSGPAAWRTAIGAGCNLLILCPASSGVAIHPVAPGFGAVL